MLPHIVAAYERWTASVAEKGKKMSSDDSAAADKLASAIQVWHDAPKLFECPA